MALTKTQLEARKGKIGGSDAAAICGKDPRRTAYAVALQLRGEIEPADLDQLDHIEFGNEMEGVLARFYERKNGVKLIVPSTITHPEHSFLIANMDRRIDGNPKRGIECKNTGLYAKEVWGEPGTDEVPPRVLLQCVHYMMVEP